MSIIKVNFNINILKEDKSKQLRNIHNILIPYFILKRHLLTEIKRKSPNDNQKELLESQSETNNLTIQDIKKQDDENYDILAQNKSENYLNNQGFNLFKINQTLQPSNQIGLNGFNNTSLQNIGPNSTNNNLSQTINSQLFGQNINKQNDSNQTQDFLFLLKKQKEQESQLETLQSLTFRQNRENDLLKKKLLELEKAMGLNGFQETKKKTCLERDEQNQFNQKTPNSNYGGTSIFNNLNNLSPNHFYSPIYDTNSSQFINYLYQQGGTSPLPYFQGSSQLQNQNLSPKHQRTEPDNFNQNQERNDKN
ncbi:hypothetical protein PPERSA_09409 [Pseudocohnilembus persalinus]|uniref:Uncharacterized protein n=1 Tax=Pseudocohnilembus persalinus TaxID=266149 RepID=A0A0V0Q9Z6_PSEPJ|nr:hypothetical protein PPERSA_09409 [Pseudocohnilembus persalinus]|eukprot:KRW98884.1 hypothetical protein PPERSA_09409 [Pseudocohnilembus persalinus]